MDTNINNKKKKNDDNDDFLPHPKFLNSGNFRITNGKKEEIVDIRRFR